MVNFIKLWQSNLPETCPYFHFPDDNLSKCEGILTKLGYMHHIKEIWFGIAYGQILSMFDRVICPQHDNGRVLYFNIFICYYILFFRENKAWCFMWILKDQGRGQALFQRKKKRSKCCLWWQLWLFIDKTTSAEVITISGHFLWYSKDALNNGTWCQQSIYVVLCGQPRWFSWMRRPTGDQEVTGSTPAEVGNILPWRLIMKYFLRSFSPFYWFKKGSC